MKHEKIKFNGEEVDVRVFHIKYSKLYEI